jgi:hypothetical protein
MGETCTTNRAFSSRLRHGRG